MVTHLFFLLYPIFNLLKIIARACTIHEQMKGSFTHFDGFKIRVEGLKPGHVEKIREEFTPEFIDVAEERLSFDHLVAVEGEAYLTDTDLVLCLNIGTFATLACSICNGSVKVPIELKSIYITEPLSAIKTGVFSLVDPLREAILLETPLFAECNQGSCPERKEFEKYFKKPEEGDGYHPFDGLKLD